MYTYILLPDRTYGELSTYEIKSLLDTYKVQATTTTIGSRLFVESVKKLDHILLRTSLIKEAERILGHDIEEIDWAEIFRHRDPTRYTIPNTYMVEKIQRGLNPDHILSLLKKSISKHVRYARVSLSNPNVILRVYRAADGITITQALPTGREQALHRQPRYRPFAPPTAFDSLLSRAIANLTRLLPKENYLDPFCGTGSLVIEAALLGLQAMGSDLNPAMVEAARMLSEYYGVEPLLLVADARSLPLPDDHVDGIGTDPPYGISSPTYGEQLDQLYESFMSEAKRVLRPGGYLVVCHTPDINVFDIAKKYGMCVEFTYSMYVHSRLTRNITVIKN